MSALVEVRNVRKSYPTRRDAFGRVAARNVVVDDVSFEIARGETLGVVGESGAGKSTLGRLALRLLEPDEGSTWVDGVDLGVLSPKPLRRHRAKMQMIFQDPYSSLNPKMTIGASVAEPLRLHTTMDSRARIEHARELLQRVGIRADQIDRYPYELSGGQLQRVAVARAVAPGSQFIVCDEPVAALDVSIRAQVLNLLRDLQDEHGLSYLFISHDLTLVAALSTRVAVMYRGRVVEMAGCEEIFASPQHPYTHQLMGAILEPHPSRRKLHLLPASTRVDETGDWQGCAYSGRCPFAMPVCQVETPTLRDGGVGHEVACHAVNPADR